MIFLNPCDPDVAFLSGPHFIKPERTQCPHSTAKTREGWGEVVRGIKKNHKQRDAPATWLKICYGGLGDCYIRSSEALTLWNIKPGRHFFFTPPQTRSRNRKRKWRLLPNREWSLNWLNIRMILFLTNGYSGFTLSQSAICKEEKKEREVSFGTSSAQCSVV